MKKSRISLMVWIQENNSTSAQKEFCSLIIYSRLPSNARRHLAPTDALRWRNTWGTWEKRTSGVSSCITPVSVAGEKRRCKTGVIRPQKKNYSRRRIPRSTETDWDGVLQGGERKVVGISQSKGASLSINWVAACLFIYLGSDRFLHR